MEYVPGGAYVLPASAGMILSFGFVGLVLPGAPRIRGDDPPEKQSDEQTLLCSPHPRG